MCREGGGEGDGGRVKRTFPSCLLSAGNPPPPSPAVVKGPEPGCLCSSAAFLLWFGADFIGPFHRTRFSVRVGIWFRLDYSNSSQYTPLRYKLFISHWYTHTHTRARARARHTHTRACTHSHTRTHTLTPIHTHTRARTHTHIDTHTMAVLGRQSNGGLPTDANQSVLIVRNLYYDSSDRLTDTVMRMR